MLAKRTFASEAFQPKKSRDGHGGAGNYPQLSQPYYAQLKKKSRKLFMCHVPLKKTRLPILVETLARKNGNPLEGDSSYPPPEEDADASVV